MCILSIVKSEQGIVITSNRDERRSRKNSLTPEIIDLGTRKAILARDAQAQGTWFLTDNLGRTAILLNGAFESHIPTPPYRESRGVILMNLFQEENFKSAFLFYNLENIEPFQVIYLDTHQAFQCVWDGNQKHLFAIDLSNPQVFFSPTLYTKKQQEEKRKHFFKTLTEIGSMNASQLLEFHSNQNINSLNLNFFMRREDQITKSISQVELNSTQTKYVHWQSWDGQSHQHALEHVAHA
jgi:uncharacterized protein with NRDE domain